MVASLRIVSEQFFPAGTDTFTTSYEKPDVKPDVAEIYDVLKKRRPCSNVVTASKQRQNKSFYFILCCRNILKILIIRGMKFCKLLRLTTLNHTKQQFLHNQKRTKRIISHIHVILISDFNIYEYLKSLEKPLWLINIKLHHIADLFHKCRSRSPKVFCRIGVLDSFPKFTREDLCQSLLFKK